MTQHTTAISAVEDEPLARRIAALMRIGTAAACVLLSIGAVLALLWPGPAATTLLTGGCALLILLPVIRLVMMAGYYARLAQKRYALISIAVLALVVASGVVGLIR